ncbi:hypothetical protein PFISCL1PPCAC_3596, partial [Pristionchus fissidentatus]
TAIGGVQVFSTIRHHLTAWLYMKWFLRPLNLMTIFNLLVFTTNEFIVIRYPLHYRRYCRRRVILGVILACWVVTLIYTVLTVAASQIRETSEYIIAFFCYLCLFVVLVCYGFIIRTIRKFHRAEENGEFTAEGQKINHRATMKPCEGCDRGRGQSKRCNSHRKWRTHLMSRHKYLIVIGTVLLVNVIFLIPYSGIQIVNFLRVRTGMQMTVAGSFVTHFATVMIGVHAVCQPLCYFRMTEFRRLACCHGRAPWSRSKSFSNHKSFAVTKTQMREDEGEELLMETKPRSQPLIDSARLIMAPINPQWGANTVKFRAHGNQLEKVDELTDKKKMLLRSRSEAALLPPKKTSAIEMALP